MDWLTNLIPGYGLISGLVKAFTPSTDDPNKKQNNPFTQAPSFHPLASNPFMPQTEQPTANIGQPSDNPYMAELRKSLRQG